MQTMGQDDSEAKLERLLARAVEAESRGDLAEAEKAFTLALFFEGKLRQDVTDVMGYVRSASSLYSGVALPAGHGVEGAGRKVVAGAGRPLRKRNRTAGVRELTVILGRGAG